MTASVGESFWLRSTHESLNKVPCFEVPVCMFQIRTRTHEEGRVSCWRLDNTLHDGALRVLCCFGPPACVLMQSEVKNNMAMVHHHRPPNPATSICVSGHFELVARLRATGSWGVPLFLHLGEHLVRLIVEATRRLVPRRQTKTRTEERRERDRKREREKRDERQEKETNQIKWFIAHA